MTAGRWLALVIAFLVLLGGGYASWRLSKDRKAHFAREAQLKQELHAIRTAIAQFREKRGTYPHDVRELVPEFLPRVPVDPITHSSRTWRFATETRVQPNTDFTAETTKSEVFLIDVRSGAGTPYSEW